MKVKFQGNNEAFYAWSELKLTQNLPHLLPPVTITVCLKIFAYTHYRKPGTKIRNPSCHHKEEKKKKKWPAIASKG